MDTNDMDTNELFKCFGREILNHGYNELENLQNDLSDTKLKLRAAQIEKQCLLEKVKELNQKIKEQDIEDQYKQTFIFKVFRFLKIQNGWI